MCRLVPGYSAGAPGSGTPGTVQCSSFCPLCISISMAGGASLGSAWGLRGVGTTVYVLIQDCTCRCQLHENSDTLGLGRFSTA